MAGNHFSLGARFSNMPPRRPKSNIVYNIMNKIIVYYLAIHVVFGFDKFASINFTIDRFASYDVSFGFVQHFNRNTDRHFLLLEIENTSKA